MPRIHGRSRVVKAGQSVIVTSMDFVDDDGARVCEAQRALRHAGTPHAKDREYAKEAKN